MGNLKSHVFSFYAKVNETKNIDYILPLIYNTNKKRGKNMSEIYLTKIERKTIFTRSLIFVLIMFIISDLTVTGPFYFNFIPWMYIIGVIGSIKKIDGVLMSVMGTFTVFVSSVIMHGELNLSCATNSGITLTTLVLGIITGKFIYEFILEHRLVKYIRHSKKIMYISLIILMFLSSCVMVALNSGDIITYLKSRSNLKEYIETTYNIQEYKITDATYVADVAGKYTHRIETEGQRVTFVPVTKTIFKDINRDTRRLSLTYALENDTSSKVLEIQNKYNLMKNAWVRFVLEYGSVSLIPDTTVLYINYKNIDDIEQLEELYDQIASCIKELQSVKPCQKVIITIDQKVLQITNENVSNITSEYIKGGFEIEEIVE